MQEHFRFFRSSSSITRPEGSRNGKKKCIPGWCLRKGNCHPRSSHFPGLLRYYFCRGGGVYLIECGNRSFVRAGKTNYRVSGLGVSHSLAERIPHVLRAEGAGLGQGRPEVLSAVGQYRTILIMARLPRYTYCLLLHLQSEEQVIVLQFLVEHQKLCMSFSFLFCKSTISTQHLGRGINFFPSEGLVILV